MSLLRDAGFASGAKQKRLFAAFAAFTDASRARRNHGGTREDRWRTLRRATAAAAADVRRHDVWLAADENFVRMATEPHVTTARRRELPFQETQEHNGSRAHIINTSSSRSPPLPPRPRLAGHPQVRIIL